ncbi:MAG: hypothetical protein DWQ04_02345 [Chloroflexi bacterium]|nr:MAG: hypothetical protein DWQ04_02345 [Chloroflexota bacterium]
MRQTKPCDQSNLCNVILVNRTENDLPIILQSMISIWNSQPGFKDLLPPNGLDVLDFLVWWPTVNLIIFLLGDLIISLV